MENAEPSQASRASSALLICRKINRSIRTVDHCWFGWIRRGRPSLASFETAFGGAEFFVSVLDLFSIGIEVAFTLDSTLALDSGPPTGFASGLMSPDLAGSAASSPFSSASVAALVSLASSFKAAAFLSFPVLGVSSSGPSAIWKLICVPKRGLKERYIFPAIAVGIWAWASV